MIDIMGITLNHATGQLDMNFQNSQVPKAANILRTQIGSLSYLQEFGVDIAYFLTTDVSYMTEGFRAYLIQRLAAYGISVDSIIEQKLNLAVKYQISVSNDETLDQYIV